MAFHPYLNFKGTCREAFTRYQEIFDYRMQAQKATQRNLLLEQEIGRLRQVPLDEENN